MLQRKAKKQLNTLHCSIDISVQNEFLCIYCSLEKKTVGKWNILYKIASYVTIFVVPIEI
jgi:hypothetical protein